MNKEQFDARMEALLDAKALIGEVAYVAACNAIEAEYFAAVKVVENAKWDAKRIKATTELVKGLLMCDYEGLTVLLENFTENGEGQSKMTVYHTHTTADGSTKTVYDYGAPLRKTRASNGKSYRGEVITLTDVLKGDGTIRVAKGSKFPGTKALAEACGFDKGKFGYYNELRTHGIKPERDWDYTQRIADAAAPKTEIKADEDNTDEKGTEGV